MANFLSPNLTRYIDEARREVNSALDRALSHTGSGSVSADVDSEGNASVFAGFAGGNSPAIDVEETDDDVFVTAELPGVGKNDFNVEIVGDRLRLSGEKENQARREKGRLLLVGAVLRLLLPLGATSLRGRRRKSRRGTERRRASHSTAQGRRSQGQDD